MNFENDYNPPTLIEPGVRYFLNETLKECYKFKEKYNNIIFNICLLIGFIIILLVILIVKYKGKLTPEEKEEKEQAKKQYILSKISNYQQAKLKEQQELITGLPHWDSEFDIIHKKIKI
jgi:large-conductance mechanosensitive channel